VSRIDLYRLRLAGTVDYRNDARNWYRANAFQYHAFFAGNVPVPRTETKEISL
jgi:hypothetical protein